MGCKTSEEFKISKGLLQGCCMSLTLCMISIDIMLKEWTRNSEKMAIKLTNEEYIFNIFFTDNQMIIAQNEDDNE